MNPRKAVRAEVKQLTDLPNIGKAAAEDRRAHGGATSAVPRGSAEFSWSEHRWRTTRPA